MYSLIVTAKLNDVDLKTWLDDVLARIAEHPAHRIRRTPAVELATAFNAAKSGRVIVAAIAAVFTIGYVANMLGEDEDWLYELSIDMFPEDGCLRVYGIGEDGVTAFTRDGIECLQQIIANERAARRAPPQIQPTE